MRAHDWFKAETGSEHLGLETQMFPIWQSLGSMPQPDGPETVGLVSASVKIARLLCTFWKHLEPHVQPGKA